MLGFCTNGFGSYGWVVMVLQWILSIALMVGLVLLMAWLARRFSLNAQEMRLGNGRIGSRSSPHEILKVRYVTGEITREQFQQMLDDLE